MKREINFRGKDIETGEWVYGYLVDIQSDRAIIYSHEPVGVPHAVTLESVGQYTELKDKNGKKIFEDDIMQFQCIPDAPRYRAAVEYGKKVEGCCNYQGVWIVDFHHSPNEICMLHVYYASSTVIGNIHDNPELLNQENKN